MQVRVLPKYHELITPLNNAEHDKSLREVWGIILGYAYTKQTSRIGVSPNDKENNMSGSKIYSYSREELQAIIDISCGYSNALRRMGMNPKGGNPETLKRIITEYEIDTSKMERNRSERYRQCAFETHKKRIVKVKDIISGNVRWTQTSRLLSKLVKEGYKERKCEICGITDWQGKPITMNLHHIDGNRENNSIENLQVLCPNCHSQTDNFAGKKLKKA